MSEMESPPRGPTEKERKYDRQLRLWAASGQEALESANVLLVNTCSGNAGIETLKNLVLPGIGAFTIADDAIVQDADLGVNFFLDDTCLGQSRARCCREYLVELNPEVTGDWYPKEHAELDIDRLIESSLPFSIILYTLPLNPKHVSALERYADRQKIPLLTTQTAGYFAYFSIKLPEPLLIVDTHPDEDAVADLRLLEPWSELSKFAADMAHGIDDQDDHEHGHLPFVVILLHYLAEWRNSHGELPSTYKDKIEFRNLVSQGARRDNPEGGEENFDEAVAAVMKHVSKPTVPSSLQQIFQQELSGDAFNDSFWIIAKAVKRFYRTHGRLPLPGGLPDMKAQSNVYVKLQRLYKSKAKQDASEVMALIRTTVGGDQVRMDEVDLFCKNARFAKLIHDSRDAPDILQVAEDELRNDEVSASSGHQMPHSLLPIFLALRAFAVTYSSTAKELVENVTKIVPGLSGNQRLQHVAEELSRSDFGELHNISAVVGGMVAQEMIKIITKQYIPVDNTCIFDGIESRCQVLRLNPSRFHGNQ